LYRIIIVLLFLTILLGQHTSRIQIVAKYEMNMSWINPTLVDSMFFSYDSFNFAGFSDYATDCYDIGYDVIEPPVSLGSWCRLTFPHDNISPGECWENDFNVNTFTQDIRYKDDNHLETNYYEWQIEFNSYLVPGKVKIFLINNELWADCLYTFEYNGEVFNHSIVDTIELWNYTSIGLHPSPENQFELNFRIGECAYLSSSDNIIDTKLISNINIYPNPFNHSTNLSFYSGSNKKTIISIYDIKGRKIWNDYIYTKTGNNIYYFKSTPTLSSGNYILNIKSDDINISKSLIYLK